MFSLIMVLVSSNDRRFISSIASAHDTTDRVLKEGACLHRYGAYLRRALAIASSSQLQSSAVFFLARDPVAVGRTLRFWTLIRGTMVLGRLCPRILASADSKPRRTRSSAAALKAYLDPLSKDFYQQGSHCQRLNPSLL